MADGLNVNAAETPTHGLDARLNIVAEFIHQMNCLGFSGVDGFRGQGQSIRTLKANSPN